MKMIRTRIRSMHKDTRQREVFKQSVQIEKNRKRYLMTRNKAHMNYFRDDMHECVHALICDFSSSDLQSKASQLDSMSKPVNMLKKMTFS